MKRFALPGHMQISNFSVESKLLSATSVLWLWIMVSFSLFSVQF
jgi:hypothetical protein